MQRRNFIKLVGGGVVFAAGSYYYVKNWVSGVPASAISAWKDAGQNTKPREYVLSYAILAPNPHNMQPWIADLRTPDEISIRLDMNRLLPATDPYGRQILMGLGCFLELLSMAAVTIGKRAEIKLFPDGEPGVRLDSKRVASIRLIDNPGAQVDPLFEHIFNRRTDRRPYDPKGVPSDSEVADLITAAGTLPLKVAVERAPERVEKIREIARAAWKNEVTSEGPMMESMKVLRIGTSEIDQHRDGVTISDPFVVLMEKVGLVDRTSMPAADSFVITTQIEDFNKITEATSAYLSIITEGNSRGRQVDAGRAYVRVNLAGTAIGLSMHPNEQSLQEYPEVAKEYQAIHELLNAPAHKFTVQMLARVGHQSEGTALLPPSPRRGLAALIAQ